MNLIILTIGVIILFIAMGYIKKNFPNDGTNREKPHRDNEMNYNDEFIENSTGKNAIPFIRTFALKDKLLLRSLLASEGIYNYAGNDSLNNLYPGLMVQGYTDTIIHIFEEDKEKARPIVEDYIRNLIEEINPEIKARAIDFVAIFNTMPSSMNQVLPEIID